MEAWREAQVWLVEAGTREVRKTTKKKNCPKKKNCRTKYTKESPRTLQQTSVLQPRETYLRAYGLLRFNCPDQAIWIAFHCTHWLGAFKQFTVFTVYGLLHTFIGWMYIYLSGPIGRGTELLFFSPALDHAPLHGGVALLPQCVRYGMSRLVVGEMDEVFVASVRRYASGSYGGVFSWLTPRRSISWSISPAIRTLSLVRRCDMWHSAACADMPVRTQPATL